jgi:ABC-type branched-subunit amino acid transport system substrate-binding protein
MVLAVALIATAACGTRLPDSAFVNAGADGGTGTAAGSRSGTGTGGAGTGAASTASGGATGAGTGAAGTGTDGGTGTGAADGPNQASDTGVTENEIVIGNITAVDGILGNAFAPPLRGLQAFVQYTNDHGGVHGRKIRLESCNDSEDRTKTLSCAQDLIENKHVFAFVANNTRAEGGAVPYIDSKGVPIFFGLPISNAASRFPHYWSIYGNGCPRDGQTVCYNDNIYSTTGIYRWFKNNVGTHKAAVFYYGLIAISADAGNFVQQGLKLEGYDVTGYDVNFANPNFDQAVQDMKNNGTDMILDVIDDGTNRKLCDTMQRAGLTVKAKVSTVVSYGDEIGTDFSDVCRNSIYISGNTMSYDDRSNPAVDEFRNAFDTYEPGQPLHQWSLEGWMAGKSLAEALDTMGATPTRQGLEDWLRGLNNYTANGLSIPIDFIVKDYPNEPTTVEPDCTSIAQWQDSTDGWVQRTSPKGDCFDSTFQYATKASDRGD